MSVRYATFSASMHELSRAEERQPTIDAEADGNRFVGEAVYPSARHCAVYFGS
ncbi:hypothetical protein [Paraburkholderia sp.]|uniref:hypothetical protein n=1 Tax=Paraburkholderia sp. TaxID=1926495 RepID=UPI0025D892C8|nr:hypothetical protein [Paraburkholderia sp.]